MKKLINPYRGFILLAFALAPLLSMAHDGDNVDKKKNISKTYTVGPDDRLSIENSFGNVSVETWDKNVIQVDVEIGVRASTDEKAQQMLDQISVSDHQSGQNIEFKTDIGRMGKGNNKGNDDNRRFYIDYKISMPARNPLHIENNFGKTYIPDFAGQASLTSKFGELTTGKITNAKLIHVEFGKANIGSLTNADVIFKFNSKSSVAGISGNSKVDVQFCSQVNVLVDNAIKDLAVYESYSTVNLRVSPSLSAQFEVYTNFGKYQNKTNFNISQDNDDENSGPKFDKNYSGTAGSGSARIKIKSSFGNVRMLNDSDKSVDKDDAKDDKDDKDDDHDKVNL